MRDNKEIFKSPERGKIENTAKAFYCAEKE